MPSNRLGPKRKNKIAKAFALDKKLDDVRRYVVRRKIEKGDKVHYKSPRIQRLVSEKRLKRKRAIHRNKLEGVKHSQEQAVAYEKLLKSYFAEKKGAHQKEEAK